MGSPEHLAEIAAAHGFTRDEAMRLTTDADELAETRREAAAVAAAPRFQCPVSLDDDAAAAANGVGTPVIGLDWRTTITAARRRMGADLVVQGNLDPALVLAGTATALDGVDAVLADNRMLDLRQHPGHIFNLGHGVQPDTDPGVLAAVVDRVHESTRR